MIVIDPAALGPCWTYRLASIAAARLRTLGYAACVGIPGDKARTHDDIPTDEWNDAVAHVQIEIGKAMRK
jgi:hypothetical protein